MVSGANRTTLKTVRELRRRYTGSKRWGEQTSRLCNIWQGKYRKASLELRRTRMLMSQNCLANKAAQTRSALYRQQWKGKQAQYNWRTPGTPEYNRRFRPNPVRRWVDLGDRAMRRNDYGRAERYYENVMENIGNRRY